MEMPKREGWYLVELHADSIWRGVYDRPFAVARAKMMYDSLGKRQMMWEGITQQSVVAWHSLPKTTVQRG